VLFFNRFPDPLLLLEVALFSCAVLLPAVRMFMRHKRTFAESL
jgi:hypothetical protein